MNTVAKMIRNQVLKPSGQAPQGNLYLHCVGGMHRTGIVFGILQRCINGSTMDEVEEIYRKHTAYVSESDPRGYEPLNLRFIAAFDCSLLKRP